MHFFFDLRPEQPRLRAITARALELDEELDDEEVLELEFDELEVETFEGDSLHCALLLDYVPPKEPPSTPLGNALRNK